MRWTIAFDDNAETDLFESLCGGAIIELAEEGDGTGDLVELRKVLVDKADGFKFYIYADEHPPPHFHVYFDGHDDSFSILDGAPIRPNGGLKKYYKNIRRWHQTNRDKLIQTWNRTRPVDCPVGAIKA